jgi:putative iron-dependent peroxidase
MGRTKVANEEIGDKSPTSHIARNDQDEVGQVLRRNIAYGDLPRTARSSSASAARRRPSTRCSGGWSAPTQGAATT